MPSNKPTSNTPEVGFISFGEEGECIHEEQWGISVEALEFVTGFGFVQLWEAFKKARPGTALVAVRKWG